MNTNWSERRAEIDSGEGTQQSTVFLKAALEGDTRYGQQEATPPAQESSAYQRLREASGLSNKDYGSLKTDRVPGSELDDSTEANIVQGLRKIEEKLKDAGFFQVSVEMIAEAKSLGTPPRPQQLVIDLKGAMVSNGEIELGFSNTDPSSSKKFTIHAWTGRSHLNQPKTPEEIGEEVLVALGLSETTSLSTEGPNQDSIFSFKNFKLKTEQLGERIAPPGYQFASGIFTTTFLVDSRFEGLKVVKEEPILDTPLHDSKDVYSICVEGSPDEEKEVLVSIEVDSEYAQNTPVLESTARAIADEVTEALLRVRKTGTAQFVYVDKQS